MLVSNNLHISDIKVSIIYGHALRDTFLGGIKSKVLAISLKLSSFPISVHNKTNEHC